MVASGDRSRSEANPRETFELERFAWQSPDRLELAGTFSGLRDVPTDEPALLVNGRGGTYRLAPVPGSVSGPPQDGQRWQAEFAWTDAPVAIDTARLELGPDVAVDLPEPGSRRPLFRHPVLDVKRAGAAAAPEPPEAPEAETPADGGAEAVRLQADLLAAQEELRTLRAAAESSDEELARVRAELEAERAGRAEDAERFRDGLDRLRASAEEAVAAQQAKMRRLRTAASKAQEALAERDAKLSELREAEQALAAHDAELKELNEALGARDSELAELRETISARDAELEPLREGIAARDAEIAELRERAAAATTLREQTAEVRAEAERLLARLSALTAPPNSDG